MTGKLVVLSQAFGFLYHNNLYVVNGIEVSRIASLWGNYSLLGGYDKIILEKDRVNFLYHYYEGATLYAITIDGKRKHFKSTLQNRFMPLSMVVFSIQAMAKKIKFRNGIAKKRTMTYWKRLIETKSAYSIICCVLVGRRLLQLITFSGCLPNAKW